MDWALAVSKPPNLDYRPFRLAGLTKRDILGSHAHLVIRLAQIKASDQVNFAKLHGSMQKLTQAV
jgi:hypothetical protein